jgi:hypothetical protein
LAALRKPRAAWAGLALCLLTAGTVLPADAAPATAPRVEARSANFLAVGVANGDKMSIHLSRLVDNAPVRDAVMTVVLRGSAHPATADSDGGYSIQSKDLQLPGAAIVEFQIVRGDLRENLKGTLEVAAADGPAEDKNSARQLWWWVLNFGVCIGVLWLFSRRRKAAQD